MFQQAVFDYRRLYTYDHICIYTHTCNSILSLVQGPRSKYHQFSGSFLPSSVQGAHFDAGWHLMSVAIHLPQDILLPGGRVVEVAPDIRHWWPVVGI